MYCVKNGNLSPVCLWLSDIGGSTLFLSVLSLLLMLTFRANIEQVAAFVG